MSEDALAQEFKQKKVNVLGIGVFFFAYQAKESLDVEHLFQETIQLSVRVGHAGSRVVAFRNE